MDNYKYIKAKVLRADDEEHKFIIEWEGKIYKIAQLAFQRRLPLPDFLDCKLLTTSSGKIFISQNIDLLMRSYYHENEEVDFKIKLTLTDKYQLEDQYGLTAMMDRETNINAALTPRVRCRIMKFRQNYMEVKLVEVLGAEKSEFSLSENDLQEIFPDFDKMCTYKITYPNFQAFSKNNLCKWVTQRLFFVSLHHVCT